MIDLGSTAVTATERAFLRSYYLDGLGEFAHRNGLDLTDLQIVGPELVRTAPTAYGPAPGRPLIPFGGGIDSIVAVELLRPNVDDPALFVVNRPGDTFDGDRGARGRHRAADRAGRAAHRRAGAALARAGLPQRARAGHRDHLRDRPRRRRAGGPRRGGHVERVVRLVGDAGRRRPGDQPPVLQERGVRGRASGASSPRRSAAGRSTSRCCGRSASSGSRAGSPSTPSTSTTSAAATAPSTSTGRGGWTTGAGTVTSAASST